MERDEKKNATENSDTGKDSDFDGSKQLSVVEESNAGKNTSTGPQPKIRLDISAIENFLELNKLTGSHRRMIPMSPRENGFVTFSERELLALFMSRPVLEKHIRSWSTGDFSFKPAVDDLLSWLGDKEPGYLIKKLLADITLENLSVRQRGKAGYRGAIKLTLMDEIRTHLRPLKEKTFDPRQYNGKGYAIHGSVRTDGYCLQLLAFKLKELQSVRYRRLPETKLPPHLTSTVGGVNYFLSEIRNISKTKDDVARLWPHCDPKDIQILGFDLGQAFVAGVSALLPSSAASALSTILNPSLSTSQESQIFHNLAASQKAVSQPTLKHRRWMEEQKRIVPPGASESIEEIESELSSLRGEDSSVISYLKDLEQVRDQLDEFYNGNNMLFKKHKWDATRARTEEFRLIANRVLSLVGGSVGRKRDPKHMVVIGIGLGQFSSQSGLSSLHGTFMAYFIQLVCYLSGLTFSNVCEQCTVSFMNLFFFFGILTFLGTILGLHRGGRERVLHFQEVPIVLRVCVSG